MAITSTAQRAVPLVPPRPNTDNFPPPPPPLPNFGGGNLSPALQQQQSQQHQQQQSQQDHHGGKPQPGGTIGVRINRAAHNASPYQRGLSGSRSSLVRSPSSFYDPNDTFNSYHSSINNDNKDVFLVQHEIAMDRWSVKREEFEANQQGRASSASNISSASAGGGGGMNGYGGRPNDFIQYTKPKPVDSEKERELDKLTNLLVRRITTMPLPPNAHGYCGKCEKPVMYADNGCSAMNQVFHVNCFSCDKCGKALRGGSFYSVDGKALCEDDYFDTLEKCAQCRKPITDRILRATGKAYHGNCFKCVVCSKNLDGVPFTVDASNQVHCIDDFHKRYSPRCSRCQEPIMPKPGEEETVRIVCMNQNFCTRCYACEDCRSPLSGEDESTACYPLEMEGKTRLLCKGCNAKRLRAMIRD